ncbi:outer membrane beta-barrel family protein [soil metagenome]
MVTNEQGIFQFENLASGTYLLKASMIGFENVFLPSLGITSESDHLDLGTVILKASLQELGEVVVKAEKNLFEMKIDRLVVNVQSSITASSGTALEVLERSPGLLVDHYNNAIRMNGKNGVKVMINGKMNRMPMEALYQMLSSMPAANIEQIELITTPPANFDAEGDAGYINLILKKNEGDGLNGSYFVNAEKRRRYNSAFGVDLNFRKNKFNLFANYSFTYNRNLQIIDTEREIDRADYLFSFNSRTNRKGGADVHNFRLGLDYNFTPKTVVGILTTIFDRTWSQVTDIQADFRINPGNDSLMIGYRQDLFKLDQSMINFNLQHNFNENKQLNLDLDYFYYYGNQPQDYFYDYFQDGKLSWQDEIRISKKTPMGIKVAKLDYSLRPHKKLSIETGIKATYSTFFNDVLLENKKEHIWHRDPKFSETASMDEVVGAAFGSFSYKINETTDFKGGIRYEYTNTKLISENERPINRKYGSIFPTVFYSKKLNEHNTFQVSYNRRIARPAFSELAPFVLFLDPVTFVTGNSFLWPAFTQSLKTDFSHKAIIISLQANRTNNAIYNFQPQSDPANNVTTYSSLNIDREDGYVASLTLPFSIMPWWDVQNNLQAMLQKVQTKLNKVPYKFSQRSFSINSSHTFKMTPKFAMELSGFYTSPVINGIRAVRAFGAVNFGLRKEFGNNGGRLNLSFSDIFRNSIQVWETRLSSQHLSESMNVDFDTRSVKLTYTKNFGSQKVKGARKRSTGSAEEQKRL